MVEKIAHHCGPVSPCQDHLQIVHDVWHHSAAGAIRAIMQTALYLRRRLG